MQEQTSVNVPPTTAVEFLTKAGNLLDERAKQYDQPGGERSMARTVEAFNAVTQRNLTEAEGWLLMQLLKDVRQWQTPGKMHQDSAEDCVSYAALKAEALAMGGTPVVTTPRAVHKCSFDFKPGTSERPPFQQCACGARPV